MQDSEIFKSPLPQTLVRAIEIARQAQTGEVDDFLEQSFGQQIESSLEVTGMTLEQLDAVGRPQTSLGRMFERLQDWWWDRFPPQVNEDDSLEFTFTQPIALLQTLPLEEIPMEYDDFYQLLNAATANIKIAISEKTEWEAVEFDKLQLEEDDGDDFDPLDLVQAVWTHQNGINRLVLVEDMAEDPKLFGHSLGLVLLTDDAAIHFAQRLASHIIAAPRGL